MTDKPGTVSTETGALITLYPQFDHEIGQMTGNWFMNLRMRDSKDTRMAEVMLTAEEKRELGMMLLDPKPSTPFVPSKHWKEGERFMIEGYSGSYPDKSKDRLGTVVGFRHTIHSYEHLVVRLDGEEEDHQSFNPDIMRHLREGEGP